MNGKTKSSRFDGGRDLEGMDEDLEEVEEVAASRSNGPRLSRSNQNLFEMMKSLMDDKFDALGFRLDDIKADVAQNAKKIDNLEDGVAKNRTELDKVCGQVRDLKKKGSDMDPDKIEKIVERVLEKRVGDRPESNARVENLTKEVEKLKKGGASEAGRGSAEDAGQYWFARRGIRCWPVLGTSKEELINAVGVFFGEKLRIPATSMTERDIVEVRRISPRTRVPKDLANSTADSMIRDEVLVVMKEVQLRDFVFKHASNLAMWREGRNPNSIGIRLQIPTHLSGRFNTLSQHGFALKRKYGQGLKRHIRFDDDELDFIMDVKLPNSEEWYQVDYEYAREETRTERKKKTARGRISSLDCNGPEVVNEDCPMPRSAPPTSNPLTSLRRDDDGVFSWGKK